jgi:hypothetical protein
MKAPTNARHTAVALLGVFVALLVTVQGMPRAAASPSVVDPTIRSRPTSPATATATFPFTALSDLVLLVPVRSSLTLPDEGVSTPSIRLRNLATVNADVCQDESFSLTWSGTAGH